MQVKPFAFPFCCPWQYLPRGTRAKDREKVCHQSLIQILPVVCLIQLQTWEQLCCPSSILQQCFGHLKCSEFHCWIFSLTKVQKASACLSSHLFRAWNLLEHFTTKTKLENKRWKAAEKQDQNGMDLISLLKITGFIPCCCYCLMMASACKSRSSAYLLPQSREHLASGWHPTAFSCSKRGKSQGQPIQPGCSAKVAVPSWGNGPLHFSQLERGREYIPPSPTLS